MDLDFDVGGIFTTSTEEKVSTAEAQTQTKEDEGTLNIDQSYKENFSSNSCELLVLSLQICY